MNSQVDAFLRFFHSMTPDQQKRQLLLWLEYCLQRQKRQKQLAEQVWFVAEEPRRED